jgi:molybdate/tungstate transport system ATP-binding protein
VIELRNLSVKAGKFNLKDISLHIEDGQYCILVGPSGSGKTVLLETISGIRRPQQGDVLVDGQSINLVAPEKRQFSLVYQDCVLFPHLSVLDNIAFGLKVRNQPAHRIAAEVQSMAELLNIQPLLQRQTMTLSGGERNKIALARSLILKPRLLLLDEPLSALDPQSRELLQAELASINRRTGVSVIHVTHEFKEAMALGQQVAVMHQGRIAQCGSASEVFRHPASEYVARFVQMRNIFHGQIIDSGQNKVFRSGQIEFAVPGKSRNASLSGIHPDAISISVKQPIEPGCCSLAGITGAVVDQGSSLLVEVNTPLRFQVLISRRELESLNLTGEQNVFLSFKPEDVQLFE